MRLLAVTLVMLIASSRSAAKSFYISDHDVAGLILAIQTANSNNQIDTIYLALGGHYLLTNPIASAFDGNSGLPDVALDGTLTNKIVVYANGATLERDGAAPFFRIWSISNGTLELYDAVIKNGKLNGAPGQNGGGISNYGNFTVANSTFIGNTASFWGGALYLSIPATSITNCTFTDNKAPFGGAIFFFSSNATVTNCTIAGNTSTGNGGKAVYNILSSDDPNRRVFIKNSIIAQNKDATSTEADVSGILISLGHNLIGENSDPNTQTAMPVGTPNNVGDFVGTPGAPIDPMLNTIGANGGLTPTMPIQSTSSLGFNSGGLAAFAPVTDQAGNNRIGNPEIGSIEFNNNTFLNPVIEIKQGGNSITTGGIFNLGNVLTGSTSVIQFAIRNTGLVLKLHLLSHPKVIGSSINSTEFSIDESLTDASVSAGGETFFLVNFSPVQAGAFSKTLSIASNDTGKTIYTFTVQATVTLPVNKITPTLVFTTPLTHGKEGDHLTISATSDSQSPIVFSITGGSGQGSFSAPGDLRLEKPGTLEITASQVPNANYNASAEKQTITIIQDLVTAIQETTEILNQYFPNPAKTFIISKGIVGQADSIILMNLQGTILKQWTVSEQNTTLNIEGVAPGAYILRRSTAGKGISSTRILVE